MSLTCVKWTCAASLLLVAMYTSTAGATVVPKPVQEPPPSAMPVANDGYLVVENTWDSEALPPRFCPAKSRFEPELSVATPCHQGALWGGKDASYAEVTAQAALDINYGPRKVIEVGLAPMGDAKSVVYWRYATSAAQPSTATVPASH